MQKFQPHRKFDSSAVARVLIGYSRGHAYGRLLDGGYTVVNSHEVQIVESKERKDNYVGDVDMAEFDLTAQRVIFDDEHAHPEDPEDEPEGGADAADDGDLD